MTNRITSDSMSWTLRVWQGVSTSCSRHPSHSWKWVRLPSPQPTTTTAIPCSCRSGKIQRHTTALMEIVWGWQTATHTRRHWYITTLPCRWKPTLVLIRAYSIQTTHQWRRCYCNRSRICGRLVTWLLARLCELCCHSPVRTPRTSVSWSRVVTAAV